MSKKYLVAGGDLRFVKLAEYLAENGCFVYTIGFDGGAVLSEKVHKLKSLVQLNERVDYLILPLPVSNDGVNINTPYSGNVLSAEMLASCVKEGGIVFGGRFADNIRAVFERHGIETIDFSYREEFAVLNAEATAEGAVRAAMEETDFTLCGQKILIIGMGRIAKMLIQLLKGFNADITAAARKYSDLAWAEAYGCEALHIKDIDKNIEKYSIIFNTAPALILDREKLEKLDKNCLVIDLASKPGGVDFETAASLGVKAVWLLSLPGRTAPFTAGITIGKTISNILTERGAQSER